MEEETLAVQSSCAAALVFMFVVFLQLVPMFLEQMKKKGSCCDEQKKLQEQIKELLKEARLLSNPSTFAQAAKLRRMAAAKEKELLKIQELHKKEKKLSYDAYLKSLTILKVVSYFLLILWFWRKPVATISQQLLQPLGKVLSWRAEGSSNSQVMVGIIPWLVISNRVSKFICQKIAKRMGR